MENSSYKNKNIEKKYSNIWYHWLINHIPESITKVFFKQNTPEQTVYGRRKKLSKPKT